MKKFSAVLAVLVMTVSAFLVASGPSVATAPYPGSVRTKTFASGIGDGPVAKVYVKVTSFGNGKPTGRVAFTFVGRKGKVTDFSRSYDGQKVYRFSGLKRGPYDVLVVFNPAADSVYKGSAGSATVKVTR